ncbi:MAG TPA: hypothetical protein VF233_05140, partial [Nitrososphaeraceae archaeon]
MVIKSRYLVLLLISPYAFLVQCPEINVNHYNLQFKYTDNNYKELHHIAAKTVCYPSSSSSSSGR